MFDTINKIFYKFTSHSKLILIVISLFSLATIAYSQATVSAGISGALCNVYNTVRNVIFLLGLALAILGGAVYALGTMMPSSHKGGIQGYGIGMIIGGIVGIAIAVAAPYLLNLVVSSNANSILTSTGASGVNTLCSSTGLP